LYKSEGRGGARGRGFRNDELLFKRVGVGVNMSTQPHLLQGMTHAVFFYLSPINNACNYQSSVPVPCTQNDVIHLFIGSAGIKGEF
jgi:hypothetical protein